MSAPSPFAPYLEEPHTTATVLVRPPHRLDRPMRIGLRFVGGGLLALGILLMFAASRMTGADVAVGTLFGLLLVSGAFATLWWMGRSGGTHRIEITAERLTIHRAGFAGLKRRVDVDRAAVSAIALRSVGEGRAAGWRLWLILPGGRVELATLTRRGADRGPAHRLADRVGVPLGD